MIRQWMAKRKEKRAAELDATLDNVPIPVACPVTDCGSPVGVERRWERVGSDDGRAREITCEQGHEVEWAWTKR